MLKSLRNFGIAFAVAAAIIGIAAMIIMSSIDDVLTGSFSKKDDEIAEILNTDDEDKPGGGAVAAENTLSGAGEESFTVLAVMTDYRPDVYNYKPKDDDKAGSLMDLKKTGAAKICLVKCSVETGKYVVVPISPLTKVGTSGGYERLYDVYADFGIDYFKAKIEAVTGLSIDRYAVINCTELSSFVAAMGAVWCPVPCDIFTDGTEYLSATAVTAAKVKDPSAQYTHFLEKCEDYIGPSSMGLLLFKDYTNGIEDELTVSAGYMKGVLANFAKFPADTLATYWDNLASSFRETDITGEFLNSKLKLIGAYTDEISKIVNISGIFKGADEDGEPVFELDSARTVDALSAYR